MAFQLGFAGGFADEMEAPPAPAPTRGGGSSKPFTWRWRNLQEFPLAEPEPEPPPPPVRVRVTIRVVPPRMRARVVGTTLWPAPLRATIRTSAKLTGPPWLQYAMKTQRDAREAREIAEIAMALGVLEW